MEAFGRKTASGRVKLLYLPLILLVKSVKVCYNDSGTKEFIKMNPIGTEERKMKMSVRIKCTESPVLSPEELALLKEIAASSRYAVANFELRSSGNDEIYTGAMEHVHLLAPDEEMTPVVERGEVLQNLEDKGLISLNYDLCAYVKKDYVIFKESKLWKELEDAVAEAKEQHFTFDLLHMEKGLAELTVKGRYALQKEQD